MNLGSAIVLAVLVIIVAAIVASWVRAHKQGKHIACDECGGCSAHNPDHCPCAEDMVKKIDEAARKEDRK